MPNLVSITHPSLQIFGQNSDGDISYLRISGQSLISGFHNSGASDDIDMKLGPVTKLDNRNKTTLKNLTLTSCRKILTSLSFFRFFANLEQSGGRIPDTESAKFMFSLIATFCFTKTKNRTKKSQTLLL